MRKARFYIGTLGLLVALTLFLGGCGSVVTEFSTYESTDYGISLQYPSNWTSAKGVGYAAVTFFAPKRRTAIDIGVEDVSVNFQDYTRGKLAQLTAPSTDFTILESDETRFAGSVAHKVVYARERGFKTMEVWTVDNGIAYVFVYTSASEYEDFLEPIQMVIDSFKITSSRPHALFPSVSDSTGFLTYENTEYGDGVSFQYPSDWQHLGAYADTNVAFVSPIPAQGLVSLKIEDSYFLRNRTLTLEDYTSIVLEGFERAKYADSEVTVLESIMTTLDGNDAHSIVFSETTDSSSQVYTQIWTVKENIAYFFTYAVEEYEYDNSQEAIQAFFDSIKIPIRQSSIATSPAVVDDADFLTYENTDYGISVLYPSTWVYSEEILDFEELDSVVLFGAPNGRTRTGLVVSILSDLPLSDLPLTLIEYTELWSAGTEELGFAVMDFRETTLAGNIARKAVYTETDGVKHMEIWTVKDGAVYILEYLSDGEYELFLDTAQRMIDSFEITAP